MDDRRLTREQLEAYGRYLRGEERSGSTVEKYLRDAGSLSAIKGLFDRHCIFLSCSRIFKFRAVSIGDYTSLSPVAIQN